MVQHAHLDRRGFQGYQARRRVLASNQDDRSSASEPTVVGDCGGDVVGRKPGRRGRCDATLQWVGGLTRTAYRPPQGDQAVATSAAELLCEKRLRRIFVTVLHGRRLPRGRFIPEPWPTMMPPRKKPKKQKKPPSATPSSDGVPSASEAVA